MKRVGLLLIGLVLLAPLVSARIEELQIIVYPDGYSLVNETLSSNSTAVVVELLGAHIEGLVVTDATGNPVPYQINGTKLIVFPNSSSVTVSYYTPDLTTKNGPLWTFRVDAPTRFTLVLPKNSVIVGMSSVPIEVTDNAVILPPGKQNVSYVLAPTGTRKLSQTFSRESSSMGGSSPSVSRNEKSYLFLAVFALVLAIVLLAIFVVGKRKSSRGPDIPNNWLQEVSKKYNLNDEEVAALRYVVQHGGRARQSEIREALGLPKTTAWRMFQRLERLGLVKIKKIGRENWIEITP